MRKCLSYSYISSQSLFTPYYNSAKRLSQWLPHTCMKGKRSLLPLLVRPQNVPLRWKEPKESLPPFQIKANSSTTCLISEANKLSSQLWCKGKKVKYKVYKETDTRLDGRLVLHTQRCLKVNLKGFEWNPWGVCCVLQSLTLKAPQGTALLSQQPFAPHCKTER